MVVTLCIPEHRSSRTPILDIGAQALDCCLNSQGDLRHDTTAVKSAIRIVEISRSLHKKVQRRKAPPLRPFALVCHRGKLADMSNSSDSASIADVTAAYQAL